MVVVVVAEDTVADLGAHPIHEAPRGVAIVVADGEVLVTIAIEIVAAREASGWWYRHCEGV